MRHIEFLSDDNEIVRGTLYEPPQNGKYPGVVFTHGLLSQREEFGTYPEKLAARGFVALAIDLRGHGASAGLRGYISEARGVSDIRHALDFLTAQPNVDTARLGLVGHSLGAAFSVCAAAQDARVKTLVAIAPPASIRLELKPGEAAIYAVGHRLGNFYKALTGKSLYFPYRVGINQLFHHEASLQKARANNFLGKSSPHENARTLVNEQDTLACAEQVRVPTLVLRGEHDRVVSTSRLVYEKLAGQKQFVQVADSGHSIMLDGHGDEVFEDVANWLMQHL
jgi:alpha-beta hydrolase superfamily lysophospholipase